MTSNQIDNFLTSNFIEFIDPLGAEEKHLALSLMRPVVMQEEKEDEKLLPTNYTEYVSERGLYTWWNRVEVVIRFMTALFVFAMALPVGSFIIGTAVTIYTFWLIYIFLWPPAHIWHVIYYFFMDCETVLGYSLYPWYFLLPSFCFVEEEPVPE